MNVLHALESYLPVSENWIFPQIARVPGTRPAVLCGGLQNLDLFPLNGAPAFLDPPSWNAGFGLPRLVNSIAFRLGRGGVIARAAAKRWKPDLIHAHFGMRGWQMLDLHKKLGAPMITSFYGMDAWQLPAKGDLWRNRYSELFSRGDMFLVEGPAMRDRLVALGCPSERIRIVHLGVDCAALPFDQKPFAAPLRVLMMARFTEKKGMPDGLRACAEACRSGADLQIIVIGDAVPGDIPGARIKEEMLEVAGDPALDGRLVFKGFLKPAEARVLLRQCDVFLCPSKHASDGDAEGGSPLAVTEAMALGLLCIGSRHCDIPEVIRHRETGLLADSGDVAGLAALLGEATSNPEASREMCRRGRAHIEKEFFTGGQVLQLEKIYGELVNRNAAKGPC